MTVPVVPVEQEILHILQLYTPYIPFHDLTRVCYNSHVPGRFGAIHTARWGEYDVEIREPFGDISTIDKEVRLLTKLKACQKIQQLHGYTIEPSTSLPHLVLQHNEHGTLHSYLSNFHPHLSWADRYNLALDIALGLRYIHQKGYRHRHLHSASILIDENGSAFLSDFGSPRDSQVLSSREYYARWCYIAPERLIKTQTAAKYSPECDIYSLGMILWEISSGRPPFDSLGIQHNGQLVNNVVQMVLAGEREEPVPGTDLVYQDLYTRCWSANPMERPMLDEIIDTLCVLLKKPSSFLARQLEALTIAEEQEDEVSKHISAPVPPRSTTPKPSKLIQSLPIKVSDFPLPPQHEPDLQVRSQELPSISPRDQDYCHSPRLPPPPSMAPPVPPVPQRRKMSTVSNISTGMAPSSRSMSVSSGSSTGSFSSGGVPIIPARDSRRISAMTSHSAEYARYEFPPRQQPRQPQNMWEACQQGNADMVEWFILSSGQSPDALAPLPAYSMLAEVSAIHVVCYYQPEDLMTVLRALQRNGAMMGAVTTQLQHTALHILLEFARNYTLALEATKFLMLECGLSVNEPDSRGLTPFHKYLRNGNLSGITSVAGSELYTLLRDKGNANLTYESLHDGNALGMTARYLRYDLMKHFLLTDLSVSEPKSLAYAASVVEAPLSETRSSRALQDQCRALLAEWRSERGETKRIEMAERILNQAGLSGVGASPSSKKSGKSSKSSSPVDPALQGLSPKAIQDIEVAKRLMTSGMVKQRKLKNLITSSGF
ncbi:Nuclear receptor sub 2 group C member 2 [Actinomortierella wolfii]|nr:Nuclear receptor sub 2 group C member 2 [Actinomortierella wolfii]